MMKEKIEQFEKENKCTVLYLTEYGSRLYGTHNENSDHDFKGIFVQDTDLMLLKKDMAHWTSNSNNTNEKNSADDIDLQLFSVHKFFELLRKGETGALDLLFSMFSPSVMYENTEFTDLIKENYKEFLNKRLHSFVGYAIGQSAKYGIKGSRFKELMEFNKLFEEEDFSPYLGEKLEGLFPDFHNIFKDRGYKYIKMVKAQGPKTLKAPADIEYVEILGKKYSGDVTINYFIERAKELEEQFGNRTRASTEGTDWKALSHSVRVINEVEELLDTGFITFPLKRAKKVKEIKNGNIDIDTVMEYISQKLDVVNKKLENSTLPKSSNRELMDEIELKIVKGQKEV